MGEPVWKRINVVCRRVVNGLNVAGYGRSMSEKSWTVPSLKCDKLPEMSWLWNFSARVQSWSAKFLKIISAIQSWSTNVKSCIYILPLEAKELLELFCLLPITIGWKQNTSSSAFASWSKIDTAFQHFQL